MTNHFLAQLDPLDLREHLKKESERGMILVYAAYLDGLLGEVFKLACFSDRVAAQLLDAGSGPASTFSAKINITYALGLIDKEERDALHIVRSIRNSAAHFSKDNKVVRGFNVLFDSPKTMDQ